MRKITGWLEDCQQDISAVSTMRKRIPSRRLSLTTTVVQFWIAPSSLHSNILIIYHARQILTQLIQRRFHIETFTIRIQNKSAYNKQ